MQDGQSNYFGTRLGYDPKRRVLWDSLWRHYFSTVFQGATTVVELGAGWCDFINSVHAPRRIAVDLWQGVEDAAADGVEAHIGSATDLSFLEDGGADVVFASNLVEHLDRSAFEQMLSECRRILRPGGLLALLQPNFRLCADRYFDDFTHVSIWTDTSLSDFLASEGWKVEVRRRRFLPLTVKSRLPVSPLLIRTYLKSPIKPLAGQMLIVARSEKG